ncbi:unnamed protein product [Effrenium voratum]|nr:unnamed protein product [Effrenium voratum]
MRASCTRSTPRSPPLHCSQSAPLALKEERCQRSLRPVKFTTSSSSAVRTSRI